MLEIWEQHPGPYLHEFAFCLVEVFPVEMGVPFDVVDRIRRIAVVFLQRKEAVQILALLVGHFSVHHHCARDLLQGNPHRFLKRARPDTNRGVQRALDQYDCRHHRRKNGRQPLEIPAVINRHDDQQHKGDIDAIIPHEAGEQAQDDKFEKPFCMKKLAAFRFPNIVKAQGQQQHHGAEEHVLPHTDGVQGEHLRDNKIQPHETNADFTDPLPPQPGKPICQYSG